MTRNRSFMMYIGLFLLSSAVLHLEILQTRIFSMMLWHHVTYLVVTYTLLGFAAAGTFVAIRPSLLQGDLPRKLALYTALFGLTTVAAFWTLSWVRLDTVDLLENRAQYFVLFVYYIYLVVPYFFGGLVIVLLLTKLAEYINRLYFINLVGSGVGCLFFIPMLRIAGGAGSILIVAAGALLGSLCFALASERRKVITAVGALLLILASAGIPFADELLDIKPAPTKMMNLHVEERGGIVEHTRWDPLCRLDVVRDPATGMRYIFQDGDALTILRRWTPQAKPMNTISSLAYLIQQNPRVLIVGVGGGLDLFQALAFKASSVTGAEINPGIDSLMRGDYAELSGHLYTQQGVDIVVAEGRSFLNRSKEKYDVIQMTGTDTYSALSSGSFVLSESYLYTLEAFENYLDHLTPGGVVAILRFRFYPPRECLKLVAIGASAMKRKGIAQPGKHIVVISYDRPPEKFGGSTLDFAYAVALFKKTPFTQEEIRTYETFCRSHRSRLFTLSYAYGRGGEEEFVRLLAAMDRGEEHGYYQEYPYDITPVSDDRPFFFAYHKWKTLLDRIASPSYHSFRGEDPVGLFILLSVLFVSVLLVGILVILPLFVFRRKGLKVPFSGRVFFYFFAIGVSFLFIEITSMQKFVLYLGHPTYSISIVLFTFLLFSGLGSLFGQRFSSKPFRGIQVSMLATVVLLILLQFLLPALFAATLRLPDAMRMGITVMALAPLAFFMGLPFPLGIRVLNLRSPDLIPWAFGINGGASVISSVISIVIAMSAGFTAVFIAAGIFYLMGWVSFRKLM